MAESNSNLPVLPNDHAAPVIFNVVPAKIRLADGTVIDKARAVCVPPSDNDPGGLFVYAPDGPGGRVQTVFALSPYASMEHDGTHWIFTSAVDGHEYHVYAGSGCGCGLAVKKMQMPPLRYLNVSDPALVNH